MKIVLRMTLLRTVRALGWLYERGLKWLIDVDPFIDHWDWIVRTIADNRDLIETLKIDLNDWERAQKTKPRYERGFKITKKNSEVQNEPYHAS